MAHMSMGQSHVTLAIIELDSFPKHSEVGKQLVHNWWHQLITCEGYFNHLSRGSHRQLRSSGYMQTRPTGSGQKHEGSSLPSSILDAATVDHNIPRGRHLFGSWNALSFSWSSCSHWWHQRIQLVNFPTSQVVQLPPVASNGEWAQ